MRRSLALLLSLFALSCRTTLTVDPAAAFEQLESRLIAGTSDFDVHAVTTGTIEATVDASVFLAASNVRIDGKGMVGGTTTNIEYRTDDAHRPADVKNAIVTGWTRMGITHNLVRLLGGQGIDHAEGGMGDAVRVTDVTYDDRRRMFAFHIVVDGNDMAEAKLWLDEKERPVRREQTVRFPGGTMHVEERYAWR